MLRICRLYIIKGASTAPSPRRFMIWQFGDSCLGTYLRMYMFTHTT